MNSVSALRPAWTSFAADTPLARGLASTGATKFVLALVVASLFLERWEMEGYANGTLPFPDTFFFVAMSLAAIKLVVDSSLNCARPQPMLHLDLALAGLVLVIGLISIIPAIGNNLAGQTIKSYFHVSGLLISALVLGRALNTGLVRFMFHTYLLFATLAGALALLQALDQNILSVGLTEALDLKSRASGDFIRPISVFSEPAYLGYAGLIGALIGFWEYHNARSSLTAARIGVCLAAMLLTSAMGPVAVGVAVAGFMFLNGRIGKISPSMLPVGIVALAILIFSPAGDVLFTRIEGIVYGGDVSLVDRSALNQGSIDIWKLEPLTGVGLGNSRFYLNDFVYVARIRTDSEFPAANVYLGLLGEVGPFGVLALVIVLTMLVRGRDSWSNPGSMETLSRALILMTALQFFVIGNFLLPPFWFWAGIRLGMQHQDEAEEAAA